jgi:hypothetical protein
LDGNQPFVRAKVSIAREDLPSASDRDGAYQEIRARTGDAVPPAVVAPVRGVLEVFDGKRLIAEGSQLIAVRSTCACSRMPASSSLANCSYQLCPPVLDKL